MIDDYEQLLATSKGFGPSGDGATANRYVSDHFKVEWRGGRDEFPNWLATAA
jgi:hypothetical protein